MKAVLYDRMGPARDVLKVTEIERPEPGPGEVLVRVLVSAINPTDVKARSGAVPRPIDGFQIPHQDGAGVIDAVGDGVDPARVGQRVWLFLAAAGRRWGTAAEWTVVPARQAVPLPDGVDLELAASLGVPAITAHRCLFADGPVTGKATLVAGGAGAVGHFSIELAKWAGARVASTVSSPEKAELARAAGADLVVNYRESDVVTRLRPFAGHLDRIIEVALGANLQTDLALSGPATALVVYAATGEDPVLPVRACMSANVTLRFVLLYGVPAPAIDEAVHDINVALGVGALTPLPALRFLLDDIAAAHEAVEKGVTGKVLVVLGSEGSLSGLWPIGLFRPEIAGIVGTAKEDPRAEPVLPSGAATGAAPAVGVAVDAAEVPARALAHGAALERVDAHGDEISRARDEDNDNERCHAGAPLCCSRSGSPHTSGAAAGEVASNREPVRARSARFVPRIRSEQHRPRVISADSDFK